MKIFKRSLPFFTKLRCMKKQSQMNSVKDHIFWEGHILQNLHLILTKVQVNLFQKLATFAEYVVYQNCSECQKKRRTTIYVHNMFCRYSQLTIFMNNEQSVVILWVSWCKNKSFWQRFTCTAYQIQNPVARFFFKFISKNNNFCEASFGLICVSWI